MLINYSIRTVFLVLPPCYKTGICTLLCKDLYKRSQRCVMMIMESSILTMLTSAKENLRLIAKLGYFVNSLMHLSKRVQNKKILAWNALTILIGN